jgi:phosphatidylserine decarboxylase
LLAEEEVIMAKSLEEWIESDVLPMQKQPISYLSQYTFFRDPARPAYSDQTYFFSPADGIILYQKLVRPDESIVDIKGKAYSLREAMRDPEYNHDSIVIGIFMTFYDVHINRVPYAGRLSYRQLDPIDTYNHPMLEVEKGLLDAIEVNLEDALYLHNNQRIVNKVYVPELEQFYYILQIADYDVDCITPFELKQNQAFCQGQRFSQIRYGSQVDLIVPVSSRFTFTPVQKTWSHVEGGIDPLVRVAYDSPARTGARRTKESDSVATDLGWDNT